METTVTRIHTTVKQYIHYATITCTLQHVYRKVKRKIQGSRARILYWSATGTDARELQFDNLLRGVSN